MRNKERENYICSDHILMVLMDSKERQRDQQPFMGSEQKSPPAEVNFMGKVCLVIIGPHNSWQHKC